MTHPIKRLFEPEKTGIAHAVKEAVQQNVEAAKNLEATINRFLDEFHPEVRQQGGKDAKTDT